MSSQFLQGGKFLIFFLTSNLTINYWNQNQGSRLKLELSQILIENLDLQGFP